DGEDVHSGTKEQALVVLENADHLVQAAVDAHRLADGVRIGEERFANRRAQHHHGAGMLFVGGVYETATLDRKERNRVGVLRFGATYDNFLNAAVSAGNQIAIAKEKTAR